MKSVSANYASVPSIITLCPSSSLELLRCFAESTLVDMVQLLFSRLPSLSEEAHSVDDTSSMDQVSLNINTITLQK